MGMALFLFSWVLLCWALKPKHRESSCGRKPMRDEEQEALVAQVGFSPEWAPRAEAERSPPCTKGCPRERERAHGTNEIPN